VENSQAMRPDRTAAAQEVVSDVFEPAIAAPTVGRYTRDVLTARTGHNAASSRVGNSQSTAASPAWKDRSFAVALAKAVRVYLPSVNGRTSNTSQRCEAFRQAMPTTRYRFEPAAISSS
jgi:hypothetical protein